MYSSKTTKTKDRMTNNLLHSSCLDPTWILTSLVGFVILTPVINHVFYQVYPKITNRKQCNLLYSFFLLHRCLIKGCLKNYCCWLRRGSLMPCLLRRRDDTKIFVLYILWDLKPLCSGARVLQLVFYSLNEYPNT